MTSKGQMYMLSAGLFYTVVLFALGNLAGSMIEYNSLFAVIVFLVMYPLICTAAYFTYKNIEENNRL